MADVFGRDITYRGSFKGEKVRVTISSLAGGALVREVRLKYAQPVSRVWDLSSGGVYFIAGVPEGQWSFGIIAGPTVTPDLLSAALDICRPGTITISASPGYCDIASASSSSRAADYSLNSAVLSEFGMDASTADMMINQSVGGLFVSLSIGGAAGGGTSGGIGAKSTGGSVGILKSTPTGGLTTFTN